MNPDEIFDHCGHCGTPLPPVTLREATSGLKVAERKAGYDHILSCPVRLGLEREGWDTPPEAA